MDSALKRYRNLAFCSVVLLSACAHTQTTPQTAEITSSGAPLPSELEAARQQMAKLQDRISDLETRLGALNDKINLENGGGSTSVAANANAKLPTENVDLPAAHGKVIPVKHPSLGKSTPSLAESERGEGTATSGEAVDRFREAKILYDTKRYSDSVLEFSEFVKNESDHALASAAQYYVGMSYFKQNEFKLAEEELSRGLLAYAHSNYVPDTLLALYEVSGALKKSAKVTYYREKLITHFPNSPQAKKLSSTRVSEAEVTPVPVQPKAEEKIAEKPALQHDILPVAPVAKKTKAGPIRLTRGSSPVPFEEYTPTVEQEKMMDSAEEPSVVKRPELPGVVAPKVQGSGE